MTFRGALIHLSIGISQTFRVQNRKGSPSAARKLLNLLEAAIGIEPMNKGFAELKTVFV
jgi:hypothetical protein